MATVGRQLCQRSCMRPASRVEPNSPITTDDFIFIAININHYLISVEWASEHQGVIFYLACYLVLRVVKKMAATLHSRGIDTTKDELATVRERNRNREPKGAQGHR